MRTIGIDTGGTFTDLIEIRGDGTAELHKVPSTPCDFAQGVLSALDRTGGGQDDGIVSFSLGTTIATNAFLTRSGARVGLLTSAGHGDTLEIMRVFGRVAGLASTEMQSYADTDKPARSLHVRGYAKSWNASTGRERWSFRSTRIRRPSRYARSWRPGLKL